MREWLDLLRFIQLSLGGGRRNRFGLIFDVRIKPLKKLYPILLSIGTNKEALMGNCILRVETSIHCFPAFVRIF